MSVSRPWLALVIGLFCLPLFVELGNGDIRDDEAIYSFAVDRMLETGDWLEPKSIPNEDSAFLEKPPLKFWIVAAPIHLGLLPHDQFSIRFWDALFGALSFGYVFLIGSRLLGGVCGAVAVLVLFAQEPLLFEHGLRSNNMEAALVLSYCGGIYHFLSWSTSSRLVPRRVHATALGLCFVLGFMTKFVAAAFLPLVIGAASLLVADYRRSIRRDWRLWLGVSAMVVALVAPWFVWAWLRYGQLLWQTIAGDAVYTRLTSYLDPTHLHPWHFYPVLMYRWMLDTGSLLLAGVGLAVLAWQTVARRWPEGLVVILWLALPVAVMSVGTSKLFYYLYPFLPPLALAAGYGAAFALLLAPAPFGRVTTAIQRYGVERVPGLASTLRRPGVLAALLTIAAGGAALALLALTYGPVRINLDGQEVFRSSGVLRPLVVSVAAGLLAGVGLGAPRFVVAVLVVSALPLPAYRQALERLPADLNPLRSARDCIMQVQADTVGAAAGLYVDVPPSALLHSHYYYFRRVRPWTRTEVPSPELLGRYLDDSSEQRPILVWEPTYQQFQDRPAASTSATTQAASASLVFRDIQENVLLLLPGPYRVCSPDAPTRRNDS